MKKNIILSITVLSLLSVSAFAGTQFNGIDNKTDFKDAAQVVRELNKIDFEEKQKTIELNKQQTKVEPPKRVKTDEEKKREYEEYNQLRDAKNLNKGYLRQVKTDLKNIHTDYITSDISVAKIGRERIGIKKSIIIVAIKEIKQQIKLKEDFKKMKHELEESLKLKSRSEILKVSNNVQSKYRNLNKVSTATMPTMGMQNNDPKVFFENNSYVASGIKLKLLNNETAMFYYEEK